MTSVIPSISASTSKHGHPSWCPSGSDHSGPAASAEGHSADHALVNRGYNAVEIELRWNRLIVRDEFAAAAADSRCGFGKRHADQLTEPEAIFCELMRSSHHLTIPLPDLLQNPPLLVRVIRHTRTILLKTTDPHVPVDAK
jgi:hypothetical protein